MDLSPVTIVAQDIKAGDRISRRARVHSVRVSDSTVTAAYKVQGSRGVGIHLYEVGQSIVVFRKAEPSEVSACEAHGADVRAYEAERAISGWTDHDYDRERWETVR